MDCEDARSLMGPFIDEEVSVHVVALMNAHLMDCLDCEEESGSLANLLSMFDEFKSQSQPPPGFINRLKDGVRTERLKANRKVRSAMWHRILPFGAVAAVVICCLLPLRYGSKTNHEAASVQSSALTAHALSLYEYKTQSQTSPIQSDRELAHQAANFHSTAPSFQGWQLMRIDCVSVNSVEATKYSYIRATHGNVITMSCYAFPGGVFDSSELTHHNIDGRHICCGTQNGISLIAWTAGQMDLVLASQLPRADLLEIALQS